MSRSGISAVAELLVEICCAVHSFRDAPTHAVIHGPTRIQYASGIVFQQ